MSQGKRGLEISYGRSLFYFVPPLNFYGASVGGIVNVASG